MKGQGLVFGLKWLQQLGFYDPDSRSLRTCQQSLFEVSTACLEILPKSGIMQNGRIFEQATLAHRTDENAFGLWPTPRASERDQGPKNRAKITLNGNYNKKGLSKKSGDGLATAVKNWVTPTASDGNGARSIPRIVNGKERTDSSLRDQVRANVPGSLNPIWVEALMGYPIGWTDAEVDEPSPVNLENSWGVEWEKGLARVSPDVPCRVHRLKALGNSIVPQIAAFLFDRCRVLL